MADLETFIIDGETATTPPTDPPTEPPTDPLNPLLFFFPIGVIILAALALASRGKK